MMKNQIAREAERHQEEEDRGIRAIDRELQREQRLAMEDQQEEICQREKEERLKRATYNEALQRKELTIRERVAARESEGQGCRW